VFTKTLFFAQKKDWPGLSPAVLAGFEAAGNSTLPEVQDLLTGVIAMSQVSKLRQSRNQWRRKAVERAEENRYLRKELARVKRERDRKEPKDPEESFP